MHLSKVILHIGLHKTGTTFLQNTVYPNIQNADYYRGWDGLNKIVCGKKEYTIISDEKLSGDPFDKNLSYSESFKRSITNLQKLVPNAIILVTVREPQMWISSVYKQHIHQGGFLKPEEFFSIQTPFLRKEDIQIKEKIEFLKNTFSTVKVLDSSKLNNIEYLIEFFISLNLRVDKAKFIDMRVTNSNSNIGIKYNSQLIFLRRFNVLSDHLNKTFKLPSLYSNSKYIKLFRKIFPFTPRKICQRYPFLFSKRSEIQVPSNYLNANLEWMKKDWNWVKENCNDKLS